MDPIIKEMKLKEERDISTRCSLGVILGVCLVPFIIGIPIMIFAFIGMMASAKRAKEIEDA